MFYWIEPQEQTNDKYAINYVFKCLRCVFLQRELQNILIVKHGVCLSRTVGRQKKSCVWSPFVYTTTTSILNGITPMQHLRDNLWVRQTIHRWLETNSNSIKCESRDWELHWTRLVGNSVLRGKTKLINCLENKFKYWNR